MISLFRIQLGFLGFCTVLAPTLLMAWFSLCPQYGNPQCPSSANIPSALEAFRNADPGLMSIFLTINTIAPYVLPLSILALGIVGMKRSPLLSTLGIVSGWMGSIAWGFIAAAIFVFNDAANLGNNASVSLLSTIYLQWQVYYVVAAGWVLGHLAGYVLLGAALWRGGSSSKVGSYDADRQRPGHGTNLLWTRQRLAPGRRLRSCSHRQSSSRTQNDEDESSKLVVA